MRTYLSAEYTGGAGEYKPGQRYALVVDVPFFGHRVRVARVAGYARRESDVHYYPNWTYFCSVWSDLKVEEEYEDV